MVEVVHVRRARLGGQRGGERPAVEIEVDGAALRRYPLGWRGAEAGDQLGRRQGQLADQPVVRLDRHRRGRGDHGEEAAQARGLRGQAAVVAVRDDQLARAGQREQRGLALPRRQGPDLVDAARLVGVGHVRGAGRRGGPGQRRVQPIRRLQKEYRRQQVPRRARESDPFADLLHEHVLVADHQTRLVGTGGDLRRVDHRPESVGNTVQPGDAVERDDVLVRRVAALGLGARESVRGRRK